MHEEAKRSFSSMAVVSNGFGHNESALRLAIGRFSILKAHRSFSGDTLFNHLYYFPTIFLQYSVNFDSFSRAVCQMNETTIKVKISVQKVDIVLSTRWGACLSNHRAQTER
jgi:hypothetical protein